MQAPDFTFKQFSIWHDKCAMKVNTDGILLGAWSQLNNATTILDIGSGTGLIALMLAQRACTKAQIFGVEIEQAAAQQASFNASQSPWSINVQIINQDIQSFSLTHMAKFDLIVSNPPYFTNALKAPTKGRELARHNDGLSFEQLLHSASLLASNNAHFSLILPCDEAQRLLTISEKFGWNLKHLCLVSTVTGKAPSRSLIELVRAESTTPKQTALTIRDNTNKYTDEFIQLCKDYYLSM